METSNPRIYLAATYDTKASEAEYVLTILKRIGVPAVTVPALRENHCRSDRQIARQGLSRATI